MSRAHNARRKAKQRQARSENRAAEDRRDSHPRRVIGVVPVGIIIAILSVVGILGFGSSSGLSRKQVKREVAGLLAGVPQRGASLGSPRAPIALSVYADLECPTVKRFVTAYLPSIIRTWVRSGKLKLEYRSLKTDTDDEHTFFAQEAAALAAGRQNKMWNYALTFVYQQGQEHSGYATEEFLADIASQVPSLDQRQWQHDRQDPSLSKRVAQQLYTARAKALYSTPALMLGYSQQAAQPSNAEASMRLEVEASLNATIEALLSDASGDAPTLNFFGP